jgi:hypothetical protein
MFQGLLKTAYALEPIYGDDFDTSAAQVDDEEDTLAAVAEHAFVTGQTVQVSTDDTLPTPLLAATDYFVIVVDANTIKLAATRDEALAGTAIDLEDVGVGNHVVDSQANVGSLIIQVTGDAVPTETSVWYAIKTIDLTSGSASSDAFAEWYYGSVRAVLNVTSGVLASCTVNLMGKGL